MLRTRITRHRPGANVPFGVPPVSNYSYRGDDTLRNRPTAESRSTCACITV
ncbi:MAG: hypothetical protein ACXW3L_07500 [Limisphaerales bacterium]